MAEKNKKYIFLGIIAFIAITAVLFMLRIWHLQRSGMPVNYLAELWWPSSVLSIVIVTFVEKLSAGSAHAKKAKKRGARGEKGA